MSIAMVMAESSNRAAVSPCGSPRRMRHSQVDMVRIHRDTKLHIVLMQAKFLLTDSIVQ